MIHLVVYLFTLGSPVVQYQDLGTFDDANTLYAKWACEEVLDVIQKNQPGRDKWAVYACVPEQDS